jgi:hypothetical protein
MDEKTTKIIKERFDALPEAVKEVILSSNYEESLLAIGTSFKNHLTVEQLSVLERETTLVMMGLTPTKNFEAELTRELGVDKEKGAQIVKEINEKIFLKIRELLKLMNTPAGENPSVEETVETEMNETTKGTDVMQSAGIEILNGNKTNPVSKTVAEEESKLPVVEKLELKGKEEIHPIMAQKLSSSVQTSTIKTEHTLENLPPTKPVSAPIVDNKPKIDPYREIPE